MKKTKILTVILSSIFFSAFNVLSLSALDSDVSETPGIIVSGESEGTVAYINDTFENVIKSFGDNAVIYSPEEGYAEVITETGEHRTFLKQKPYTLVSMKSGTEPPVEEINKKIGCNENYKIKFIKPLYSDVYKLYIPENIDKDLVYNILKNDENVLIIEERLDVLEKYCTLENILINSELSDAELIDIYPEFNLKKSEKDFTEYYPEYNHYFDYADICTKETYNAFKRLSESGDLYCLLGVSPTESNDLVYASSKNIVYQAEKIITGDVNCDGKIDLTDLSELSLALIGDKELTEAQQKAADVDCDGDVRLADLAKFQQFISKQIDSLG